jgi:putative two-component system response regulator
VALADFYDAICTPRIYRPSAFTHQQASDMISEARGKHFDPDIVDAFLASHEAFIRIHKEFVD